MTSFKLKLVGQALLLALLPLTAVYFAVASLERQSETDRVDARLQATLRAVVGAYGDEVASAGDRAVSLARNPRLQRALQMRDAAAARRAAGQDARVRVSLHPEPSPAGAAARTVTVVRRGRVLGQVTVSVPLDGSLLARLRAHAPLEPGDALVVLRGGEIVAGPRPLRHRGLDAGVAAAEVAEIAGDRYRLAPSGRLPDTGGARVAVLVPQSSVERAVDATEHRLLLGLGLSLVLIGLATSLHSRGIVRTVRELAVAANEIAHGRLGQRVPVRGRDEFATLGRAFNDMAAQLEARLEELERERERARDANLRFGQALTATHDLHRLRRILVESAVEASGATGGALLCEGLLAVEVGDTGSGTERLEVPLLAGRRSFGSLVLTGDSFGTAQREDVAVLAAQAVVALENAHLHRAVEEQALLDGLTGLANRRQCDAAIEAELARASRGGGGFALVLADLDGFKGVNDRYGHPVGDAVLREFATVLRDGVREGDTAARWGGEEFAVVVAQADLEAAAALAERLRSALERRVVLAPDGSRITLTASFGVAAHPGADTAAELVAAADAALYAAKRGGKNRVECAPDHARRP